MKTSNRLLALVSLLGVSTLSLTGCVIPFGPKDSPTSPPTDIAEPTEDPTEEPTDDPTEEPTDDVSDFDLEGTEWTGTIDGDDVILTFNGDGTIDFDEWGDLGQLDSDRDTWEVTNGELTISLAYEDNESGDPVQAELSGPVAEDTMRLSGVLQGYPMTAELERA